MKAKFVCAAIATLILFITSGFSAAAEVQNTNSVANENELSWDNPGPYPNPLSGRRDPANPTNHFDFGFMYWYVDYKEDVPPPGKSTEKGWLPGFYLGFDRNKGSSFYAKIFTEFSFGDDTYDGTTQTGTPISFSSDNYQFFFRGEINLGYNFAITPNISIIPYTGYGFRVWNRGQTQIRSIDGMNVMTIKEEYSWHYIPVGIAADFKISNRFSIEPNAGARFMFYGKMDVMFSQLDPGFNNPDVKLGNRIGYYAEIPLRYRFSKNWSVILKPWYAYDEIGQSDTVDLTYYGQTVGALYEPPSVTHQYGINVGLSLSY